MPKCTGLRMDLAFVLVEYRENVGAQDALPLNCHCAFCSRQNVALVYYVL